MAGAGNPHPPRQFHDFVPASSNEGKPMSRRGAVGYARVSTDEQARENNSLAGVYCELRKQRSKELCLRELQRPSCLTHVGYYCAAVPGPEL
jgi:hypothetical protein